MLGRKRLSTRKRKPIIETSDEEPEPSKQPIKQQNATDSSSESDLDSYLKPAHKIDLNSSFFDIVKHRDENEFESIENNIFAGVTRLESDSESEVDDEEKQITVPTPTVSKRLNFQQLHDYTKKLEEAKNVVEKYEVRRKAKLKKNRHKDKDANNIADLLAKGEAKAEIQNLSASLHSSDYETLSDSDKDWEEVEEHDVKDPIIVKDVQITVQLPGVMRKKKGVDLIASMKRRLNRVRKENQVFVHKVHLLCWIGYGNHVNKILNNEELLGLSMSLLPSQHCYPAGKLELSYLEAVVKWFANTIPVTEDKTVIKDLPLDKALHIQINRKQAYNKKMLVFIFICMLRSLGIQCRLVLSFVVAPLRPLEEDLHSLSTKSQDKSNGKTSRKRQSPSSCNDHKPEKKLKQSKTDEKQKNNESDNTNTKNKRTKASSKTTNNESAPKNQDAKTTKMKSKIVLKEPKVTPNENIKKATSTDKKVVKEINVNTTKPNLKKLSNSKTSRSKLKDHIQIQIPQVDGANDSEAEPTKPSKKPNLKKLSQKEKNSCPKRDNPKRLKKLPSGTYPDSEDDFTPELPTKIGQTNKVKKSQCDTKSSSQSEMQSNETKKVNQRNLNKSQSDTKPSSQSEIKSNEPRKVNLRNLKKSQSGTKLSSQSDIKSNQLKKVNLQNLTKPQTSKFFEKNNVRNDIIAIMKGRMAEERTKTKLARRKQSKESDYDSDYVEETVKRKRRDDNAQVKVKRRVQVKPVDDNDAGKKRKGVNVWVEVYLESEETWISVDVSKAEIHCTHQLYTRATHPVTYVVAWNNNSTVKDITQRYCPNWNTVTRKLRIDKKWLDDSLQPYYGIKTARDKKEDEELSRLQLDQPLPKTINEYKDHPLYVLDRHLLKFQAIYPPDSMTLGFIRKEPVYSRDCVHTLHSRDTWLKHAKVVKLGEKPYKVVKARPKYDRLSGQLLSALPLEIFGKWQVEDYVPPIAKDGIVPRNAYGNVELFKACMLPKGTVHLQLPGLNKLAKKMNIDCVPAVVGFDVHSGWTHPTFDGFIVCEEFSESLIAAWYLEQDEREKRDQEKFEKRVYDNWKRLIKGLLIRERLKARYDYGAPSQADDKDNKRKSKTQKKEVKKCRKS